MREMKETYMDLYNRIRQVPENAKKPIAGGRLKGMTDIKPQWRIETLTREFGPCGIGWYYTVDRRWTEQAGNELLAFVDISLFVRIDDESWSMPIPGTGGSKMLASEKSGLVSSDECYKMATTDAISVACKQLGMGADVYWDTSDSKYYKPNEGTAPTQEPAKATAPSQVSGPVAKCAECGKEIPAKVNDYSISKYKKPLCFECQGKYK